MGLLVSIAWLLRIACSKSVISESSVTSLGCGRHVGVVLVRSSEVPVAAVETNSAR